ncbi:MAG: ribonuclease HII [Candidatus Babeliales bacterium]
MFKKKSKKISLNIFEKIAWEKNLYCCGIDEVGRGCLAGPLVTACVILPINTQNNLLKDSKKLTEKQRQTAYNWIIKNCFYATAISCNQTIDKLNIYQATLKTMHQALINLFAQNLIHLEKIKYILIDAMPLKIKKSYKYENLEILHFNYGETISQSIAAASIVAKVTRDNLMEKIDNLFPKFGLKSHKGYASQEHCNAIKNFEPTIIHRKTFIKNILWDKDESTKQQNIF